jgi:hypothetical protein
MFLYIINFGFPLQASCDIRVDRKVALAARSFFTLAGASVKEVGTVFQGCGWEKGAATMWWRSQDIKKFGNVLVLWNLVVTPVNSTSVSTRLPSFHYDSTNLLFHYCWFQCRAISLWHGIFKVNLCGYVYQWKIFWKLQCAATMRHSVNSSQIIYSAASQNCHDSNHNSVSHWCQPTEILKDVPSTVVCSKKGSILYYTTSCHQRDDPLKGLEVLTYML